MLIQPLLKPHYIPQVYCENKAKRLAADSHLKLHLGMMKEAASVPLLTDDSQIGANLRVCGDEENRADWDQRG